MWVQGYFHFISTVTTLAMRLHGVVVQHVSMWKISGFNLGHESWTSCAKRS